MQAEGSKLQVIGKFCKRNYKEKSAINDVNDLSDQKVKSEDSEKISLTYTFIH